MSQINLKFSIYVLVKPGFKITFYHSDRRGRRGGGVALLVSDLFDAKVRNDIYLPVTLCEYLSIEVRLDNSKNIIVGIIYRDFNKPICDFNENMNACLEKNIFRK